MSRHEDDGRSNRLPWGVVTLLLLPVLYVLSTGPLWWLLANGYLSDEFVSRFGQVFYAPLGYLVENSETFLDIFLWYVSLFHPVE